MLVKHLLYTEKYTIEGARQRSSSTVVRRAQARSAARAGHRNGQERRERAQSVLASSRELICGRDRHPRYQAGSTFARSLHAPVRLSIGGIIVVDDAPPTVARVAGNVAIGHGQNLGRARAP